jgi:NAD-dependent deacetylase
MPVYSRAMANDKSIVILTGAGISAESGVPTFRGPDGLWEGHRVEDVATPEAYARNPALVQAFYNARRAALPKVVPNAAHLALVRLEREFNGTVLLVTQNVDDLHERAGSKNLLHMHGELRRIFCIHCQTRFDCVADVAVDATCEACKKQYCLRPDIVWFGEMPYHMEQIEVALAVCDLFISIGTSGNVYPAAGFVSTVRYYRKAKAVELNLEPSSGSAHFHTAQHGPAGEIVPRFVNALLLEQVK